MPFPRSLTFQFKNRWVSSFSAYRNQISLLSSNLLFPLPLPLQIDIYTSSILRSYATPGPTFHPSRFFSRTSVWPPLEREPHVSAPSNLLTSPSTLPIPSVGIHLRDSEIHQSKTCRFPGGRRDFRDLYVRFGETGNNVVRRSSSITTHSFLLDLGFYFASGHPGTYRGVWNRTAPIGSRCTICRWTCR